MPPSTLPHPGAAILNPPHPEPGRRPESKDATLSVPLRPSPISTADHDRLDHDRRVLRLVASRRRLRMSAIGDAVDGASGDAIDGAIGDAIDDLTHAGNATFNPTPSWGCHPQPTSS